jgi:hypothetical protein
MKCGEKMRARVMKNQTRNKLELQTKLATNASLVLPAMKFGSDWWQLGLAISLIGDNWKITVNRAKQTSAD